MHDEFCYYIVVDVCLDAQKEQLYQVIFCSPIGCVNECNSIAIILIYQKLFLSVFLVNPLRTLLQCTCPFEIKFTQSSSLPVTPKNIPGVYFEVSMNINFVKVGRVIVPGIFQCSGWILGNLFAIPQFFNVIFLDLVWIVREHVLPSPHYFYVIWQWVKCSVCWNVYDTCIMLNREGVFDIVI